MCSGPEKFENHCHKLIESSGALKWNFISHPIKLTNLPYTQLVPRSKLHSIHTPEHATSISINTFFLTRTWEINRNKKNLLTINPCLRWTGASLWKLVTIMIDGWMRYAQYVNRLNGRKPLNDNKPLIDFARPQQHDNVIHINANPHAIYPSPISNYDFGFCRWHCVCFLLCVMLEKNEQNKKKINNGI